MQRGQLFHDFRLHKPPHPAEQKLNHARGDQPWVAIAAARTIQLNVFVCSRSVERSTYRAMPPEFRFLFKTWHSSGAWRNSSSAEGRKRRKNWARGAETSTPRFSKAILLLFVHEK